MGLVGTLHGSGYHTTADFWHEVAATGLTPRWLGPGAAPLGCRGPVTPESLAHAMAGRTPDGQVELVRPAAVGRQRYGTEILLCAPPAFSALLAVTPQASWHRVFQAHEQACQRTVSDRLSRDFVARTGAGGADRTPCQPAAAVVTHMYSRRGTPLVHDHAVLLKQGHCPADGKARAVEADPVYQHQRQMRADYHLRLSNEVVHGLGLPVERHKNGFTVAGMTPAFLAELTPGKAEIGAFLLGRGVADTPAARALAAKLTRPEKQVFEAGERATAWAAVARRHGVAVTLSPVRSPDKLGAVTRELDAYQRASDAAGRLASRRGLFDEASLRLELTRASFGTGLTPEDVRKATERLIQRHEMFGYVRTDRGADVTPAYVRKAARAEAGPRVGPEKPEPIPTTRTTPRPDPTHVQHARAAEKPRADARDERRGTPPGREPKADAAAKPTSDAAGPAPSLLARGKARVRELYDAARPRTVITVRADLPKSHPRSLDRLIADARKTPLLTCHAKVYARVWGKWFANTTQKLAYAEAVFRHERRPKLRLDSRTTVVVEKAEVAPKKTLARLQKLARRSGAAVDIQKSPPTRRHQTDQQPAVRPCPRERTAERVPPPPAPAPALAR